MARADELRQESARREEAAARKDGEASVLENDVLHTKETVARLEREMETARKSDEDTAAEIKEKQEAYSRNEEGDKTARKRSSISFRKNWTSFAAAWMSSPDTSPI